MAASFVLSLREGLEAALIIGIVLGVLRKTGHQKLVPTVWAGVISASAASLLAAAGLRWLGAEFEGRGEEIFEGLTMLLAAGVLTWMVFWIHRQARNIRDEIEMDVHRATLAGGGTAIFSLAFLAILREGIELGLFLQAASLAADARGQLLGAGLGLAAAVFLGWLLFTGTRRLNLSRFFQVTNFLLALFAAGMVGLAIHEFNEVGWIPALVDPVWSMGKVLADSSTAGQLLKALIGYSSEPSLTQVLGYTAYLVFIGSISIARLKPTLVKSPV